MQVKVLSDRLQIHLRHPDPSHQRAPASQSATRQTNTARSAPPPVDTTNSSSAVNRTAVTWLPHAPANQLPGQPARHAEKSGRPHLAWPEKALQGARGAEAGKANSRTRLKASPTACNARATSASGIDDNVGESV